MKGTFLRPNRNTTGLAAILIAMWYAGASQGNAAAYLLGFLLSSVALVSAVHAWSNLRPIRLRTRTIAPVFVGEMQLIEIEAETSAAGIHPGLQVQAGKGQAEQLQAVQRSQPQRIELRRRADKRGSFESMTLMLWSVYPLGFFTAFRRITLGERFYIYPKPEGSMLLPRTEVPSTQRRDGLKMEGDDFAGTRAYQLGESQRHIDWKAAARGQPLLVKQWSSDADETLHFEWRQLTELSWESRLGQLARWIVIAQRQGFRYGLRLPWCELAPGSDEAHFHRCLQALASAPEEESEKSPTR